MNLLRTSFANGLELSYLPEDSLIGGQIAVSGIYEPYEETLLLDSLKAGETAIDIGANIGVYTLQMAKKVGKRGKVYAFEPEPTNVEILKKNIADNGLPNVTVYPFALSNENKESTLYLSQDNFGDHRVYDGQYHIKRKTISIQIKSLDSMKFPSDKKISVMKIDTQGYEPFVIAGAKQLIQEDKPKIFLEYWPYAYQKSHADTKGMLDFLFGIYQHIFIIDGHKRHLIPFYASVLSAEKDEWCNVLFT